MATYQLGPNLYTDPDQPQIDNILRKGGFLLPDPPAYNPLLQTAPVWDLLSEEWVVTDLPVAESVNSVQGNMESPQPKLELSDVTHAPI